MSILSKIIKKKERTPKKEMPGESFQAPAVMSRPHGLSEANTLILHKPWITEKTTDLSKTGKYAFIVDKRANKLEIKKAVEAVYNVNVTSVRIVNIHSRKRRLGRSTGKKSGFKKTIVTLRAGEAIDIMPH